MQLADTHTHLYLPEFDHDRDEMVATAVQNGVEKLLMPNIDRDSVGRMLSAADRYPGICYPMIGLHPTSVKDDFRTQLREVERLLPLHPFRAIGEIGIDLYWDKTHISEQTVAFRTQIDLAISCGLPVVIHSRDSFNEIFEVLDEFRGRQPGGVFHAFSGDTGTAMRIISMGFKLGIGGIVTFKNSGLDRVVREIGPDHLVLETDSPWLAPAPYRGKRNESSYITLINRKISEITGIDIEETARITYSNSVELFNIG